MRRFLFLLLLLIPFSVQAQIKESVSGYCERGGESVITDGRQSTTKVQRTFTSCTVTVYISGTTVLATIFPGNTGTATKSNPFTADTDGYWQFFANPGRYDVRFSGAGITTPFTRSGFWVSAGGASALPNCTTSQLLYYAASGTTPACLSLGTNLSISSGVLNAAGGGGGGAGSVTSVGLSLPPIFTVSGSPVTTTGTLTATLNNQNAKQVLAGPVYGVNTAATPTFRALNEDDVPNVRQAINVKTDYYCSGDGATTTTGTLASGLNTIGGVGSTSGWKVGMGLRLAGAGSNGADLVSTVTAIDTGLSTITIANSASTSVTAATLYHHDGACLTNALTAAAAAGGKTVYLAAGTYLVNETLTVPGGVTLEGDGKDKSIIKSTYNGVIVDAVEGTGAYEFKGPNIRNLAIQGDITKTSQIGLRMTDNSYYFGSEVASVNITDLGLHGLSIGNVYNSTWRDIYISNVDKFPLLYDSANMRSNSFENIYIGNLVAADANYNTAAFRIKAGDFTCKSCNGVNNVIAGSKWAVVGKKSGTDGDVANGSASFTCIDCNLETWVAKGILSYYGSYISVLGNSTFAMDATGSGTGKAIEFEHINNGQDYYAEFVRRGYIDDSVVFQQARATYANSQPIHANGFAPLQIRGRGPAVAGEATLQTFRNSTTGATASLSRADGNLTKITVTNSQSFSDPTIRYIEANCAAACTITLPWPGWYRDSQEILVIKDISGNAITNNVTIAANNGGTVNGGSYILNQNNGAVVLAVNDTLTDWRVVSSSSARPRDTRQAINVADFGCDLGDNATNDTTCIAAAIEAARAASGKTLYFPKGTYNTDPITVSLNGFVIEGDGQFNSIIKARQSGANNDPASAGSVFYLTTAGTAHRLVIRDLGIQGAGKAAGDKGYCIFINDANTYLQGFEFSNLDIRNCRTDGIKILTIFNGTIQNVHTDDIGGNHFDLGRDVNTVTLIGNYVHTVENGAVGFRLRGGTCTLIGNNGMDPDSGVTAQWGLFGSDDSDTGGIAYFTGAFIGNNVEDFGNVGLSLRPGSRLGTVSGSSFSNKESGISHIAILFEGTGLGGWYTPAGTWDASNRITLVGQNDTWSQGQAIHSRQVPFYVIGEDPSQYYDTFITTAQYLPGVSAIYSSPLNKTFSRTKNFIAETLAVQGSSGQTATQTNFTTNPNGSNNQSYILPTAAPASNGVVLTANTNGQLSWVLNNVGAATPGPIATSGLTIATSRLAGRRTAGTGAIEEIAIGSNLSLDEVSGVPTLNASGGSGATPAGTGSELQYRVNGTTFGAVSTATSDGTNLTITSGGLRVTSPRITTSLFDSNGNSILALSPIASSVNQVEIENAATTDSPALRATGSDTNIDLRLGAKGTGAVRVLGTSIAAGSIQFAEDTDNGTNTVALAAPANLVSNITFTLPTALGTAGQILQTDANGNLSWVTPAGGGGNGTVTSVALTEASGDVFSISGSPITTSGSITLGFDSQAANRVFASPAGASGVPTFRQIVAADISGSLTQNTSGSAASLSATLPIASGGTGAVTATAARTALNAAANGANSDITSLTGLTTPLSITQGGTGIASRLVNDIVNPAAGLSVLARYTTSNSNPVANQQHTLSPVVISTGLDFQTVNSETRLINTIATTPVVGGRVYMGPSVGATSAAPTFRALAMTDLSNTGTPNSTTFLRGDGQWAVPAGASGVTSITRGAGMENSGSTITSTGTIGLATTNVVPGSYTNASITVDAYGRLTTASNGTGGSGATPAGTGTEIQYRFSSSAFGATNMSFANNVLTATCNNSSPSCLLVQNTSNPANRLSLNASGFDIGTFTNPLLGGKMSWSLPPDGNGSSTLTMDLYALGSGVKALAVNCASDICTLDLGSYGTAGDTSNQGRIRLHNSLTSGTATNNAAVMLTAAASVYGTSGTIITSSSPTGANNYGLYLPFNEAVQSTNTGAGVWWAPGDVENSATAWAGFWYGKEGTAGGGFNFQGYAKDNATTAVTTLTAQAASLNIRSTNPSNLQSYGPINFRFSPGRAAPTALTNPIFHVYRAGSGSGSIPYIRLYNNTQTNSPTVATTIVGALTQSEMSAVAIDGSFAYCSDCVYNSGQLSACAVSPPPATGTFAIRLNGTWRCF